MTEVSKRDKLLKTAGFVLKIGISAAILYLLFSKLSVQQLKTVLSSTEKSTIGLILICGIGVWSMEYIRFYTTLGPVLDPSGRTPLWQVFFSGYAFRFTVPGGHGEIGKMLFVNGRYSQRLLAYLSDKGGFAFAILVSGLVGIWKVYPELRKYYWFLPFAIMIAVVIIWIITHNNSKRFSVIREYPFKKILPITVISGFVHVFLMATQYWLALKSFQVPFPVAFSTVSIVLVVIMLPISFAGLGLREWTSVRLLMQFGVTKEMAIIAPLSVFVFNMFIPALIGVGVILFFRMKPVIRQKNANSL